LGRSPLKRQQKGFTLVVKMLCRHQHFAGHQRRTESLIARLTRVGLNPQPLIGERHPFNQKRYLPLLAYLSAVRHPIVGVRAEAVVNMHRPQLNGRILFAPANQAIQEHARIQPAAKGH
jgi:hypothetical protein